MSSRVSDPMALPKSNPAYSYCGPGGITGCEDYDYDNNEVGFAKFEVRDGDGAVLNTMTLFEFGTSGGCGLTDPNGYLCDFVNDQYRHAHVGKGECLEGVVTLEKQDNCGGGNDVYGWDCLNGDC